jgi:hypothetical protein
MRMRALEPPRGSETSGVRWRNVEGSGLERRNVTAILLSGAGFVDYMWTIRRGVF